MKREEKFETHKIRIYTGWRIPLNKEVILPKPEQRDYWNQCLTDNELKGVILVKIVFDDVQYDVVFDGMTLKLEK